MILFVRFTGLLTVRFQLLSEPVISVNVFLYKKRYYQGRDRQPPRNSQDERLGTPV